MLPRRRRRSLRFKGFGEELLLVYGDLLPVKPPGPLSTCDTESIACWQRQLSGDSAWKGNELYFAALIYDMMEFDNEMLPYSIRLQFSEFRVVFDESRHVTGSLSNPFIETMSTIVLLTSDGFLKWLIVLNLLLLLLVIWVVVVVLLLQVLLLQTNLLQHLLQKMMFFVDWRNQHQHLKISQMELI